jgi:hypothetical protein
MMGMLCRIYAQLFTTMCGTPNAAECSSCRLMTDWHRLPVEVRVHVDALLRRRGVLAAIIALRELDPGRSLREAQVIAETRFGELDAAGEIEPAPQATAGTGSRHDSVPCSTRSRLITAVENASELGWFRSGDVEVVDGAHGETVSVATGKPQHVLPGRQRVQALP